MIGIQYVVVAFIGLASGIVVSSALFSVLVALGAINKTAILLGIVVLVAYFHSAYLVVSSAYLVESAVELD